MRLVAALWCTVVISLVQSDYIKDESVFVLTDENFDDFLKENPTTLIVFVAPWCSHCKNFEPEFEKAAAKIDIPFGKVDTTKEHDVAKRQNIESYPTIKFWKDGKNPIIYKGSRDSDSIVNWLRERTDPSYRPPPNEVVSLNTATLDEFIADKPLMLLQFYAPWCDHCKKMEPEYEQAALRLKAYDIPLAKVDAVTEKGLAVKYGIDGYPTLKVLRFGRRYEYEGSHDSDGIVSYMLEQLKPAARELSTVAEARRFISEYDVTIIGFFTSTDSKAYEEFSYAAETARSEFARIGYTIDTTVFKEFKAQINSIIIFYPKIFHSKYEDKTKTYNKKGYTSGDVLNFWRENSISLVGQRTRDNVATRYGKNPLVVVYYGVDFSFAYREGTQYWRNKILPIANKYKKDKYRFAIANEDEFASELQETGLGDSGLEHNVIAFGSDGKKYPMRPEIYEEELEENLEAFMKDLNSGKVKPYVKSVSVPKSDKGPIKTLVSSNFEKTLKDESKDYLVEFYAPWCGHCKQFEPQYIELANKLEGEKDLVLAKFDATTNDPPEDFKVEGFPTIYFAPEGLKNKPIKYTGNRDLDDLISFMKKHAVNSFLSKEEL